MNYRVGSPLAGFGIGQLCSGFRITYGELKPKYKLLSWSASKQSIWIADNLSEGSTVYPSRSFSKSALSDQWHGATASGSVRRTRAVSIFHNQASYQILTSAVFTEIGAECLTCKSYLTFLSLDETKGVSKDIP
jgi:hypothetical protein